MINVSTKTSSSLSSEAYDYLLSNLPSWDVANKESLGFHDDDVPDVDGLGNGIATLGINISLEARQKYFWTANVSKDIFHEFVVPYAHVNEARNNWRPYLTSVVERIMMDHVDIEDINLDIEEFMKIIQKY